MISFTQIIFLIFLLFLLFGDVSKIYKNLTKNINNIKKTIKKDDDDNKKGGSSLTG